MIWQYAYVITFMKQAIRVVQRSVQVGFGLNLKLTHSGRVEEDETHN